jgi:hypothetical protein
MADNFVLPNVAIDGDRWCVRIAFIAVTLLLIVHSGLPRVIW